MAHFAKLGLNYKVLTVIVVNNKELLDSDGKEVEQLGIDFLEKLTKYPYWVQTSYNGNFRKNYAGHGYRYDEDLDAFIPPKPYNSWVLGDDYHWEAPTPYPGDEDTEYMWDEESQDWSILAEQ